MGTRIIRELLSSSWATLATHYTNLVEVWGLGVDMVITSASTLIDKPCLGFRMVV